MPAQAAESIPARPATVRPRCLILANPNSFRMSQGSRLDQVQALASSRHATLEMVSGPADIACHLARHCPGPEDLLVIIGGDGTLQAAVSQLAAISSEACFPQLLVLGGGRTNFTARDLNSHARLLPSLAGALQEPSRLRTQTRTALRLEAPGQDPLYGFFVAGALVDHVIRDCHRYRSASRGWLRTGHPSSAWRVLQLALLGLIGRSDYRPAQMSIDAQALGRLAGPLRILLLSTLLHEQGRLDPYADRGQGPLRLTAITTSARGFWMTLPGLLHGRFTQAMQPAQGFLSGRTDSVHVEGLSSICLDGQEYELDPGQTVCFKAGPSFRFLCP